MRRLSVVLLVALAVAGCKKKEPAPQPQQEGAAPGQVAAPSTSVLQGKVLERIDATPYTYLRLQTAQGEVWAAVQQSNVEKGQDVTINGAFPNEKFVSKSLNRTFDKIYFGSLGGGEVAGMPAGHAGGEGAMGGGMAPMGGGDMSAHAAGRTAYEGDVKVAKAAGADARTIAEVYTQRAALKEKPVTIRGTVVKVNENIMGRNWIHLQDGTGTGPQSEITVTSTDPTTRDDVVIVKGIVRVDKDPGTGSKMPVLIEDAKVTVEGSKAKK